MIELKYTRSQFHVGQKLWRVDRTNYTHPDRYTGREVEIISIGRKWLTIGAGRYVDRAAIDDLRIDGGEYSSPGRCWLSRKEWEEACVMDNGTIWRLSTTGEVEWWLCPSIPQGEIDDEVA